MEELKLKLKLKSSILWKKDLNYFKGCQQEEEQSTQIDDELEEDSRVI
jgi:hypothetical protein